MGCRVSSELRVAKPPYLVLDGATDYAVKTSHFSPYTLIDELNADERVAALVTSRENLSAIKTGDTATYFTVASLWFIMTLALGLMLNSKINKHEI